MAELTRYRSTISSVSRQTNIILALRAYPKGLTSAQIKEMVNGYDEHESAETFGKKFRRDRKVLAEVGFEIKSTADSPAKYYLDLPLTIQDSFKITPKEAGEIKSGSIAALSNPGFFMKEDLVCALMKIGVEVDSGESTFVIEADGDNRISRVIRNSIRDGLGIEFSYSDAKGVCTHRSAIPVNLFTYLGDWYLHAFDQLRQAYRTFKLERIGDIETFELGYVETGADDARRGSSALPFQFGDETFEAKIYICGEAASRLDSITSGIGEVTSHGHGYLWTVEAKDSNMLCAWVISNSPGLALIEPLELADSIEEKLLQMGGLHG